MSLLFRWLGVAGVELVAGEHVLVIDPFFTRPSLKGFIFPVLSDAALVAEKLPACDALLVTHPHWDHLLDVAEVVRQTKACVFGSSNTCQLLRLQGVPDSRISEVRPGDRLTQGPFEVEVVNGQHSWIPLQRFFNGNLTPGLHTPLRLQDYRMDICLGFCISVMDKRILICAAQPQPAEVLFVVAQETQQYYLQLFKDIQPSTVIPIHWDNFLRPLSKPLQRFSRPGRMPLWQLTMLVRKASPSATVIIPEIFKQYEL